MTGRVAMAGSGALLLAAALLGGPAVARAIQLGAALASAPVIGAVVMLAIARVTGARWAALAVLARPMPAVAVLVAVAMLAGAGTALPTHLSVWQHPLFAAGRAAVAGGALAWAGWRLARGASVTFAAVTLALYAWAVTPIATDWLLAPVPGHSVSAIGMMLATEQIGGACAAALVLGLGDERARQDWGKLLVAAALGLCYLVFMDYLIVWFGNLPSRVGFYVRRGTPVAAGLAWAALLAGLVVPIVLLGGWRGERARVGAGVAALLGLALGDWWWLGAGWLAVLLAPVAPLALWAGYARRQTHG